MLASAHLSSKHPPSSAHSSIRSWLRWAHAETSLSSQLQDRNRRCGVEIVTGTIVADRGTAAARAEKCEVGVGIVVPGDPHRSATRLLLVTARRPRIATRLARSGNRERAPGFFAGLDIERRHKAADSVFAPRGSH